MKPHETQTTTVRTPPEQQQLTAAQLGGSGKTAIVGLDLDPQPSESMAAGPVSQHGLMVVQLVNMDRWQSS